MIIMSKTYTPELTPEVLDRLEDYADVFRDDFSHKKQAPGAASISRGCSTTASARASSPSPDASTLPPDLDAKDPEQALQQFVNQSPWDDQALGQALSPAHGRDLRQPRGDLRLRRHQLPQAGEALRRRPAAVLRRPGQEGQLPGRPVGPLRQPHGPLPAGDAAVPARVAGSRTRSGWTRRACRRPFRQSKTKGAIALELLDTVRGEGLPGWLALADAGYGVSEEFREGLAARGLKYIVGVTDEMVVFTEEPKWEPPGPAERPEGTGGRPRTRPRLAEGVASTGEPEGLGRRDAPAEGDLARGDQGEVVGPLRLAAGLAGRRLGHGRLRRRRADLAVDRAAGRRQAEVRLQQPAAGHDAAAGGPAVEDPLAGGAGLSADEGRIGPGLISRAAPGGASTTTSAW